MKAKELLNKLKEWWSVSSGKRGRHPILAILFSVLVAIVLWFYVQDAESPNYTRTIRNVSVELENLTLPVIDGGVSDVEVVLIGKRADLNRIKESDVKAYIDFSNMTDSGDYYPQINVMLPDGASLNSISQQTAWFRLDEWATRNVPVDVEPLAGVETAADMEIEPVPEKTQISVKGPLSKIKLVDRAVIAYGDLGERTQSFDRTMDFQLVDENGQTVSDRYLTPEVKSIKVTFTVNQIKTVPLVVKTKYGYWAEDNWNYDGITPQTITVKGEPLVMANVSEITALTVDETQFDGTSVSYDIHPYQLELPQGVSLVGLPANVKVTVTVKDLDYQLIEIPLSSTRVTVDKPKAADGTALAYTFDKEAILLKVRGPAATVKSAVRDDFLITVDLSAYSTPGVREVEAQVVQTSATEGKFYVVGEYKLTVTVSEPEA